METLFLLWYCRKYAIAECMANEYNCKIADHRNKIKLLCGCDNNKRRNNQNNEISNLVIFFANN